MAFTEFRTPYNSPSKSVLDIERFAYDVFAYMLRICGLPEERIPTSSLKANVYKEVDFVRNVGLSALPISLYKRDEWRTNFEEIFGKDGIPDFLKIQNYLECYIVYSDELGEEDTLSKIQYSLALYNEYILYLNSRDIDTYLNILPQLWSHLCKKFAAQSENLDETLDSMLTMCPDISESWISNFIRNFAIPYGSTYVVSDKFSVYALECHGENDSFSEETSTNGVSDYVPEESDDSNKSEDIRTYSPESSNSELSHIPYKSFPLDSSCEQQEMCVDTIAHSKNRNGLVYVLNQCLKGRKRTRSQELDVENAFGNINLEKENISPEQHDTKRRRKISGKDKLE